MLNDEAAHLKYSSQNHLIDLWVLPCFFLRKESMCCFLSLSQACRCLADGWVEFLFEAEDFFFIRKSLRRPITIIN